MIELIDNILLQDKDLKEFGIYVSEDKNDEKFKLITARGSYPQTIIPAKATYAPITFEKKKLGLILAKVVNADLQTLADQLAPVFAFYHQPEKFQYLLSLYTFLEEIRNIAPDKFDWIGLYFKESAISGLANSTDLIIGPYVGEVTEHVRIPIDKGLCGLALREQRIVNMPDVHTDTRHIACSLKTKSELIIPLKNSQGEFVAELDIDSHTKAAFRAEIEEKVRKVCENFRFL